LRWQNIKADTCITEVEKFTALNDFPLVVKPTNTGGSFAVSRVNNILELKNYFTSHPDLEKVVLQQLIVGDEYFVDTFSYKGIHHVVSIQKYAKQNHDGNDFLYRTSQLLRF
jgi:D-alanine-D-alanine ligase-like ATP-grasp enzyme